MFCRRRREDRKNKWRFEMEDVAFNILSLFVIGIIL